MGAKQTTNNISNDKKKLGAFYRPELTDERVNSIEAKLKKGRSKFFIRGIVCGFLFEYFIGVSTPFEKINKRSVMRRLNAKQKEDQEIQQKQKAKQKNN